MLATLAKFKICWRVGAEDVLNHIGLKVTTGQAIYYFHFTGQSQILVLLMSSLLTAFKIAKQKNPPKCVTNWNYLYNTFIKQV